MSTNLPKKEKCPDFHTTIRKMREEFEYIHDSLEFLKNNWLET